MSTRILAARGVLPPHRYPQAQITDAFADTILQDTVDLDLLHKFHRNVGVEHRNLALPLEQYGSLKDFGETNDAFIAIGTELGAQAVTEALAAVGMTPQDVDVVVAATVTGFAVPTLDARIAQATGMREDVVRVPLVGLGCVAGAAGIARMHDLLAGRPDAVGVLVSVELCSLTVQRDDASIPNLVGSGLFGDGASAVVVVGADHPGATTAAAQLEVLATSSRLYPDSERTMGWDVGSTGLRIVLDNQVPVLVERYLGGDVDAFLTKHDLSRDDIAFLVAHPGGPKVLDAMQAALGVEKQALQVTWDSLAAIGNLSSSSVLHVLADTLADHAPEPGSYGLLLAMGPGFCSELVLVRAVAA